MEIRFRGVSFSVQAFTLAKTSVAALPCYRTSDMAVHLQRVLPRLRAGTLSLAAALALASTAADAQPLQIAPPLHQALQEIRNSNFRQAAEDTTRLQEQSPQDPLPFLLTAEAYWGMIYYQTGHITPKEIWNVSDMKKSEHDKDFLQAADQAIEITEQMKKRSGSTALAKFYGGYAHGAKARFYALREQSMKSASEAKQMRADLLDASALDTSLVPDADLGLGTYNYYADVLSPILKLLRWFAGIPGGNREKGLHQLHTALQQATLWNVEAQYELARIYGVREDQHSDALALFRD